MKTIKFEPKLVFVDDYHEFKSIQETLAVVFPDVKFRVYELVDNEYADFNAYVGIVYIRGSKPDKQQVQELVDEAKDSWNS